MGDEGLQHMHAFLDLFPPLIRKNVEIVPGGPAGGVTFHISVNSKIKRMEPCVSRRTMNKEDRSVPRISTAQTLNGCLSGYSAALYDWESPVENFLGGWKIYQLNYDYALRPNTKLLGDALQTEELWLVGYDRDHASYPTTPIGEFFFTEVGRTQGATATSRIMKVRVQLRIGDGFQLPLNKVTLLRSGCYELVYNDWYGSMDVRHPHDIIVKPISSSEYQSKKKIGAGLLNNE